MNLTIGILEDYVNLQKSGANWDFVSNDLTRLAAALHLDPKCVAWLQSRIGPERFQTILGNLHNEFAVADAFVNKDGAPDEDLATTDDVPGASFRVVLNHSSYSPDPPANRWDTILHELAHVVGPEGFIQNDGDSDPAQDHNQSLIEANCFQTLKAAF